MKGGENGCFMNIHSSLYELSTFDAVLPHPQDDIISWAPDRRGPPVLHFFASQLACPIAAIGFGLSCAEYDELVQFK